MAKYKPAARTTCATRLYSQGWSIERIAEETGGSIRSAYRWVFEGVEPMPVFQRRILDLLGEAVHAEAAA